MLKHCRYCATVSSPELQRAQLCGLNAVALVVAAGPVAAAFVVRAAFPESLAAVYVTLCLFLGVSFSFGKKKRLLVALS